MADRVSFDTNVFWHGMLPSIDQIAPTCRRLVRAADDGEIEVWCSTLLLVELPKVMSPELPIEKIVSLTESLRLSRVQWVPLTQSIAFRSRELALERSLTQPYDAVMIATAVEIGATTLMTYDRDDFPIGRTIDGVSITTPALPPDLAQTQLPVGRG